MLYVLACILVKPLLLLLYRPKVHNRATLKRKGKVIYIANHVTMADPIVIAILVWRCIHFMAKSTLFESKFMNLIFRGLLTFPVQQYTADTKAIKKAVALLNKGKAFGIFPEGHRCTDGQTMDTFDKGCAFIAQRANAPIVPMYIMPDAWKFGGRMRVAVGDPIYPEEIRARCPGRKPVDAINAAITDSMLTLKERAEAL